MIVYASENIGKTVRSSLVNIIYVFTILSVVANVHSLIYVQKENDLEHLWLFLMYSVIGVLISTFVVLFHKDMKIFKGNGSGS